MSRKKGGVDWAPFVAAALRGAPKQRLRLDKLERRVLREAAIASGKDESTLKRDLSKFMEDNPAFPVKKGKAGLAEATEPPAPAPRAPPAAVPSPAPLPLGPGNPLASLALAAEEAQEKDRKKRRRTAGAEAPAPPAALNGEATASQGKLTSPQKRGRPAKEPALGSLPVPSQNFPSQVPEDEHVPATQARDERVPATQPKDEGEDDFEPPPPPSGTPGEAEGGEAPQAGPEGGAVSEGAERTPRRARARRRDGGAGGERGGALSPEAGSESKRKTGGPGPPKLPPAEGVLVSAELAAAAEEGVEGAGEDGRPAAWRASKARTDVKSGRFSEQERALLRGALSQWGREHGKDPDDLSWALEGRKSGVWQYIGRVLHRRTLASVYACAVRMLDPRNFRGAWSAEDDALLAERHAAVGPRWSDIGKALGRLPTSCRDRWREIRLGGAKKAGRWSAAEEAKLAQIVREVTASFRAAAEAAGGAGSGGDGGGDGGDNGTVALDFGGGDDARSREEAVAPARGATRGGTTDKRDLLDNIDWDVVSERMGDRTTHQCLEKWYSKLRPSMVEAGEWGRGDDKVMLLKLVELGCRHVWEAPWGHLVPGRGERECKRRWRLMCRSIPDANEKSLGEAVDWLADHHRSQLGI